MSQQQNGEQFVKDLNEFLSKLGSSNRKKSGPRSGRGRGRGGSNKGPEEEGLMPMKTFYFIIIGILVIIGLVGAFYKIDVSEEGVVTTFGRYKKTVDPGLHMKLPYGIDKVYKVETQIVHQEEFGFRTLSSRRRNRTFSQDVLDKESLMLTGDLNVADVEWTLQYKINDPQKYLFNARDVETNIRDVSISIMRRVVGDKLVNDVLTTGRVEIADEAKNLTQQVLDKYNMGIKVVRINLQDVNPPDPVKGAFNEVNAAKQEQEQTINQAEQEYNRRIPEARGQAEQTIRDAEAYAVNLVNGSLGDARKFESIYKEYVKAPAITKKRLYLETMREIFRTNEGITVVDQDLKGILPVYGPIAPGSALSSAIASQGQSVLQDASLPKESP